ncbi:hypothetical protein [Desulfofustis glycolicus]|uniref:Uncharacterized protein n=1 Tax=Desulfofustis glycolicus DSM 9705 TaxID=1121409 RepID=A0A1M5YHC3_9BACT|nr:hypothetical protein [Desulfofustis glycolicus]MCB2217779.1 hypothetical protein [Desulfobulbaceae bacterium]SHI11382.1 hypothetical protein SAMN02745124_04033 [Desulfofustis glycolicus DSM 9705]
MNVPFHTFWIIILLCLVFFYPVPTRATWDDQQTGEFFQDLETKTIQLTEAKDVAALRHLRRKVLAAFSPGQLDENWRPMALYFRGCIETAIAFSIDDQQEKDSFFSNAMQSFSQSAVDIPGYCMNCYMQALILYEHFDEPEEALIKIEHAVKLCPGDQGVQKMQKYITEGIAAKSAATNSSSSPAIPDKGKQAVPEPAPSGGSRVFEPIPFE